MIVVRGRRPAHLRRRHIHQVAAALEVQAERQAQNGVTVTPGDPAAESADVDLGDGQYHHPECKQEAEGYQSPQVSQSGVSRARFGAAVRSGGARTR